MADEDIPATTKTDVTSVPVVTGPRPTTATAVTGTAALTMSAVTLVPVVKWAEDSFPSPAPDAVTYFFAAGLLVLLHFGYASVVTLAEKWGVKIPTV